MPKPVQKISKVPAVDRLREIVEARIAEAPYEFEGHKWAAEAQEWYRGQGFPPATLRRLIAHAPFDRRRCHVEGKVTTLIRIGTPGEKTKRQYYNELLNIWRQKMGRRPTPLECGCMMGLVEIWPCGEAPAIFKVVLENWSEYMSGAKLQINAEGGKEPFLKYLCLTFLRRFPAPAVELLMMRRQMAGQPHELLRRWLWDWELTWETKLAAKDKSAKSA